MTKSSQIWSGLLRNYQIKYIKSQIDSEENEFKLLDKLIAEERGGGKVYACFYVPVNRYSDEVSRVDYEACKTPVEHNGAEKYHETPYETTGKRTGNARAEATKESAFKKSKDESEKRLGELKARLEETENLIKYEINSYTNGVSVRLDALELLNSGWHLPRPSGKNNISVGDPAGQDLSSSRRFRNYLMLMLLAFELVPVFFLKIIPLLGWYPSRYIYRYSMGRINAEKKLNLEDRNGVFSISFSMDAARVFDVLKRHYTSAKFSNSLQSSNPLIDVSNYTFSQLIVVLMLALRLPVGIIAAVVMLLSAKGFDFIRSMWIFNGI